MFQKKRLIDLKSIYMSLFAMVFIFGGLFVNTPNAYAAGVTRTVYTSYTLSEVVSTPNTEGGVTTKVIIGCAPGSGDLYDINTGKPCVNFTKKVLVGCAVGSGDLYDINTGKPCTNVKPVVMTGCKAGSGDIYDITTGKLCTNNTNLIITIIPTQKAPTVTVNKVTPKTTAIKYNPKETTESIVAEVMKNNTDINNTDDGISGREKVKSSMLATAGKVGSILTGPMSILVFLLIIIIVLGGGYGIYNILRKDEKEEINPTTKEAEPITPVVNVAPIIKEEVKSSNTNPTINANPTSGVESSAVAK